MAELRSRLTASAQALRDSLVGASAELESAELNAKITAITDAMEEATSAKTSVQEARKGKPKPDEQKEEDDVDALVSDDHSVDRHGGGEEKVQGLGTAERDEGGDEGGSVHRRQGRARIRCRGCGRCRCCREGPAPTRRTS